MEKQPQQFVHNNISYSLCSKWQPFARTHARSGKRYFRTAKSMMFWLKQPHSWIKRCFKWSTSRILPRQTRCWSMPHTSQSTGFRSGLVYCEPKTPFLKHLSLRNCAVNFAEICKVYSGNMISKAVKRIFNSDKICGSYSDLNFGVTFLEHSV